MGAEWSRLAWSSDFITPILTFTPAYTVLAISAARDAPTLAESLCGGGGVKASGLRDMSARQSTKLSVLELPSGTDPSDGGASVSLSVKGIDFAAAAAAWIEEEEDRESSDRSAGMGGRVTCVGSIREAAACDSASLSASSRYLSSDTSLS